MTICYFGIYNPSYSRHRILIKGLRQNGIEVIECNSRLHGVAKYIELAKKHFKIRKKYDIMIVGFPGYQAVIFARFLTRKKIIFDAFTSIYDSMVYDRRLVRPRSLKAMYYWLLDWLSCKLADKILLDTNANIEYFVKTFKINRSKFLRVFVGSDNEIFYPLEQKFKHDYFSVHFHGYYIPLQGIEYIVRAAKILEKENIKFNLIGSGQTYKNIRKLAEELKVENINFIDRVPYEELKNYIAEADICLGIFGTTEKTQRVIPNKVYEYLAMGRPVITGDSPAIRELFNDRQEMIFCKVGDAEDLAKKILELKNNGQLRNTIAKNGYNKFINNLIPKILGGQLKEYLCGLL
jgi:glycosyltransferase involved in cell wall biosynthesis